MKAEITCRTARNRDVDQIVELVKEILSEFDLPFEPGSSERDLLDIEASYMNSGGIFLILENSRSRIVGTAALLKVNDRTGKLRKMYIDKSYRKQGLGKTLLENILAEAESLGFEEIVLETVQTMKAAIGLYEKYGFRKLKGCAAVSPRCEIVMSKNLVS